MNRRHGVVLPALCWNRQRRDFYAVTVDVSTEGIRFRSSAVLMTGENLTCSIRHIGLLKARIVAVEGQEFLVTVKGRHAQLCDLARQFLVLARRQRRSPEPARASDRIVPVKKIVQITLEGGATFPGHVLNISASGIALLVDRQLELGARIIVGAKPARVSRHFQHGVAAAFMEPFEPSAVHERMTL